MTKLAQEHIPKHFGVVVDDVEAFLGAIISRFVSTTGVPQHWNAPDLWT